jgi:magnesium transporter
MLGLGESISIQSMTVTIQLLRSARPTLKWYSKNLFREIQTALLIGLSSAVLVGLVVVIWKSDFPAAAVITTSIILVQLAAAVLGLSVPALLHKLKLDPKIAAGPITLALTDIFTILFYLGLAAAIL